MVEAGVVPAAAHGQAGEARELAEGNPALLAHHGDALQAQRLQPGCPCQALQAARAQLVRLQYGESTFARTLARRLLCHCYRCFSSQNFADERCS